MLKERLMTAAVLIPLVIWGIFGLSTFPAFSIVIGVFVSLGVLEWTRLIGLDQYEKKQPGVKNSYLIIVILLMFASFAAMQNSFLFSLLLIASVVWWTVQLIDLPSYEGESGFGDKSILKNLWTGIYLLVPTWASLMFLHQQPEIGSGLVMLLLLLIWTADSGAYFAGRKFGKNKLAPLISPGKTKEGAYGAFAASGLVAFFGGLWLDLGFFQFIFFIILSLIVVVYSIGGDLLESVYKRRAGVKDSGTLLPGHGGVLDRIDSLMVASPVFTLGIWVLGII